MPMWAGILWVGWISMVCNLGQLSIQQVLGDMVIPTESFGGANGKCFRYDQTGVRNKNGNLGLVSGQSIRASAKLEKVECDQDLLPHESGIVFKSTPEEDALLLECAKESVQDHNSGSKLYNLYTNNCTDAVADIYLCAGIDSFPNRRLMPKPNEWMESVLKSIAERD